MFFFSKKIRQNRGFFFFNFYKYFPHFSKTAQYFFLILFAPLRRVFKTSFGKFREKKSEYSFFKKFRTTFFFCEKINFTKISQVSRKPLNIFNLLFFFPLEKALGHLLENSEKKIGIFLFQKISNNFFFCEKIHFYKNFSNISETTQYFQFIVFRPLRRGFKTSFRKFREKKTEYSFSKKIEQLFFCEKIGRLPVVVWSIL